MKPYASSLLYIVVGILPLSFAAGCGGPLDTQLAGSPSVVLAETDTVENVEDAASSCLDLGEPESQLHQEMMDALNDYRQENGLNSLIYSRTLQAAADAQAQDLYERHFFDHINPDGETPGDRAINAGFCHTYVGENLAAGQKTLDRVMQAWKESTTHNQNMLLDGYVYCGMGHYTDPNGRQYWVQLMAYDLSNQ